MFNGEVIEQYRDGSGQTVAESIQIFKESVIENYLECNKENAIQNYNKATRIKIAQWFLFCRIDIYSLYCRICAALLMDKAFALAHLISPSILFPSRSILIPAYSSGVLPRVVCFNSDI